jgi:hypothetical protein
VAWKRHILVVANVTAGSDELLAALRQRAERESCAFTMVIPATPFGGGRTAAHEALSAAIERLTSEGLQVQGSVGDGDPLVAVTEIWDPKRFDEIIISTLPMRVSKWLHAGLPERIGRQTGATVTHVISQPARPQAEVEPAPAHEKSSMGPLSVLGWGGQKRPE